MNINQYAVYQLKESAELAAYRSRSYQYLVEQHFHMIVQNYQQAYFTKLFTSDTPEMIRKRLEEHRPKNFRGRPFGVGDVIVINQQGEITAYFVDKDSLVVVAGFIRSSSSGILVTLDTKNLFIDGCAGTWMATEECVVESQHFFLMQHEVYKEKAPNVIVDASGKLVSTEIRKGLDEDARKKILDYLHKSKKNNNDRTQYRQKNHHEAIVSREVFNAANHLRASRNYSKKDRPLPVLSVVEDGILRGYVPFDKDWTGFSAEEYREASESVMKEPDVTVTADVKKRLDLTGYEIVRVQYFSTMQNPAMTISNGRLRFNTACLKKFENVEYVELLLNSVERCIAIRPCDKNNPNAIRWGRLKEGRWCASTLGCRGLAKTLFDIMEWDEDLRYRFRGQFLEQGDNKMMLFAFDEPEMIKVEEIVLPPKENTEEDEGETVKKKIYIFPPEWAGTFGQPITSIAQVGILRQEHYAGNWDVFRPATEIEEMNIFTAESLNELLREAEKIMEGWTDYR